MTGTLSPVCASDRWFTVVDGARLRELRNQRGLSAAELAGKAGIGLSTVRKLERQPGRSCRGRTLARLAAALGQPVTALAASQPPPGDAVSRGVAG
jgi:transcriptional regulator with XRE-family HTH domain